MLLLLLPLLLLSQRELSLQLRVTQLPLSSITPNTLKSPKELLLSLRTTAPHVQTARMSQPVQKVVPNQSLQMMLLLSGSQADLWPTTTAATDSQPVSALEVGIIRLLLREPV